MGARREYSVAICVRELIGHRSRNARWNARGLGSECPTVFLSYFLDLFYVKLI